MKTFQDIIDHYEEKEDFYADNHSAAFGDLIYIRELLEQARNIIAGTCTQQDRNIWDANIKRLEDGET